MTDEVYAFSLRRRWHGKAVTDEVLFLFNSQMLINIIAYTSKPLIDICIGISQDLTAYLLQISIPLYVPTLSSIPIML